MNKKKVIKNINPLVFNGIAHRGLHNDIYSENSIGAFKNAIEQGLAFELDVHLTKDNELVVFHDNTTDRMTGKSGVIEELTLEEIQKDYRLPDGSVIPALKEVLDITKEKVPILVELKPNTKLRNYLALAKRIMEELKDVKSLDNFVFISFYPQCLKALKKYKVTRLLLIGEDNSWTKMFRRLFEGIDIEVSLLQKDKSFQAMAKKYLTVCWTIRSLDELEIAKKHNASPTFENLDYKVVQKTLQEN